ncbi:MAG: cadherin domain-containing protein, partial [Acidobacteriota bacterium]|nr:cadherin domain-containing protein [Acidobacteriota bacterium]
MAAFSQRRANLLALLLGLSVFLGSASAVNAQRLFRIVESEAAASAPVGSGTEPRNAAPALELPVDVDLDLLRSGPERLEMLTPERDVIVVERTVFEDRGGGNVMWQGRVPGHVHDTVVLTIHESHLLGEYGTPGETKFEVLTRRSANSIKRIGIPEDVPAFWCAAGPAPVGGALSAIPPPDLRGRATPSHAHTIQSTGAPPLELDVLVLYTPAAEALVRDNWLIHFGAELQATLDYANLVLSNTNVNVRIKVLHVAPAPAAVVSSETTGANQLGAAQADNEVKALRSRYGADIVYLAIASQTQPVAGQAWTRERGDPIKDFSAWAFSFGNYLQGGETTFMRRTFIHEIGHNLGMNHDHANTIATASSSLYPYAFGYTDTSRWPAIATIMSYGTGDAVWEPYFSTTRVSPNGWILGVVDSAENERLLRNVIASAITMSDHLPPRNPANLTVRNTQTGGGTPAVSLTWTDRSANETGFVAYAEPVGGATISGPSLPADTTSTTITGLTLGIEHDFFVTAIGAHGNSNSNTVRLLVDNVPDAPFDLQGRRMSQTAVELAWRDDSTTEESFQVEYRLNQQTWSQAPALPANTEATSVSGLQSAAQYEFRVAAKNTHGTSRSESLTLDLSTTPPTTPVLGGAPERREGRLQARLSWPSDSATGVVFHVQQRWAGTRKWRLHQTIANSSGNSNRSFVDVSPLGSRDYRVVAINAGGRVASNHVTLNLRSLGADVPISPGYLVAAALSTTSVSLSWNDYASNETGYDVYYRTKGATGDWILHASLPADSEAATVANLSENSTVEFRVATTNANGAAYSRSVTVDLSVTLPELVLSAGVSRVPPANSELQVDLAWTVTGGTPDAPIIVQHRALGGGWDNLGYHPAEARKDTYASLHGNIHHWRVEARNAGGTVRSNVVTVDLREISPLAPARPAVAQTGPTELLLTWSDESDNEDGFDVSYWFENERIEYARVAANAESLALTGLHPGRYQIDVYSVNAYGRAWGGRVFPTLPTPTPAPPLPASNLMGSARSATRVDLSWTDNADDEAGFDLAYRREPGHWTTTQLASDSESATVEGLRGGESYVFRVLAKSSAGSLTSNWITVDLAAAPPQAPTAVTATAKSGTRVEVSWNDESEDETGFKIQHRPTRGRWIDNTAPADAQAATVKNLNPGTTYRIRVRATNEHGDSLPSNEVSVTTLDRPTAPSKVTVNAVGSTSVRVGWRDNSSDETAFDVEYRKAGGSWEAGATLTANTTSATLTGLLPSTSYGFRVRARNRQGRRTSSTVSLTMPPAAPSGLSASVASSGRVDLAWTDNSSDETAFQVEYRENGIVGWTREVTVKADVESATVDGLDESTMYEFRVIATNTNGESTPSGSAFATTRAATLTVAGLASGTVAENAVYTSATPTVSGHRGAVTWTKEGADAADFTIASATGALSMVARDHEDARDANKDNAYEVTVKATDADGITGTASITVTVTDVNEAPAFSTAAALAISVPEGTTGDIGSPVAATDPEGAALTYSLTGTDASAFQVSAAGQISLATGTVLNHERKTSYSFNVVVSDGATQPLTATRAVTLTVTDVDESLTIAGLASGTVAENAAYTSATPTVSGHRGTVTWTKEGADAADFTIASATGALSMVARDHEDAQDANKDNAYEVTVKATDADGITGTASITVTVTNVNEAPSFSTATALAISVPEGTTGDIGSPVTATDPEGASLTYSLTGTDASAFQVSAAGQISLATGTVLNHERKTSYSFNVVVSDGATQPLTATRAVTLTVTDVDESLTISGLASGTVAENAAYTSATPTVSGHRGAVTWTKEGADAADFTIASATGALSMVARDHEDARDANKDNAYEVTVKATDADGITGTASITVTVTDVNEAPAFSTAAALAISVPEGTTGDIGSPVAATDPEGAALTYSLTGTDASAFQVSAAGQISLATGTVLNHEQKASYSFNVVVSDGATQPLTATRAVTVTVTDVDESLTISGLASGTVAENAAYTSATPTVSGHRGTVTWTKEGADAADFTIASGTGVLKMVARDHEDAQDANTDNAYEVTVKATDADGITGTASITVTVTNVNEAPSFSTATALAISVPEGTTGDIGSPVTATDPEGAALTYSLTGADASAFQVSAAGQISLATGTVLNHEQKASYSFNMVVSDGATQPLTATRAVTVTVTDVAETLTISGLANGTVAENAAYTSATPTVSGHRGTVTWTKEGADAADFTIASATGALSMVARDHESPADANKDNVYEVTVKATDQDGIEGTKSIIVTVTDVNEAPSFSTATALAISVPEGTTGNIGSPVTATDPEGAQLAYSLTGTDASAFRVSAAGQISLATGTVLNHERKTSYSFNVVVSDGATQPLTATRAVTVTVTDVDETLTISGLASGTVAENAAYTSATPTVSGHRGTVTWTKEGADAADFTIASGTGVLKMVARNHEDARDANTDNVYEVTVKATDQDGITGTASITVTVTNVNEAPSFSTATALAISVPEGTTGDIGSPVTATDPEGAALTYSLTGADASAFQVSAAGQISLATGTVLNHEQKASYSFNVVVSDGATQPLTATRAVTVTVTDVAETLTISGLANGTVAENAAYTSATPTVSGHRGTVTWTKEGADAADFTIASGTGVLKMVARDHEDAQDANTDNVYEVTVKATDQDGITGTASITVTVTDVNEAPAFSTAAALAISVPEGTTGDIGSPVTATDPEGASLTYSLTGTDASAFRVSAAGQISLATGTVLNHERKTSYSFNVVVSDGATQPLTATRAVTVTVTDVDETLTISGLASGTVAENAAYTSATPTVSGHRGTVTWTKEGADAADFTIASATGALSMVARDHESPADANKDNAYEVTVKATDADGITGTASITVTVTDVNEAPAFSAATALAISVPEGTTGNIGSPVTATDPEGATLAYSLTGTDASAFQVSAAGQISLATGTVLNHEQKASYSFNVVVSDGATQPLTATRAVTLTVTDVDESLTISGLASGTVAENAAYTSATPTVSGHRGTVTWTKEGADAADFTIVSTTGVLRMVARDHEDAQDANTDNVYEVTVKATDQDGIAGTASITVTVTDVNEAPAFSTATALAISVPEGTTGNIGSPVTATDPEGAQLAYSLTGTDAASFAIDEA